MSTGMIYNYCVHGSAVSARLCLVVLFCCHMSNDHTDVLFERINDDDDEDDDDDDRTRPSVMAVHSADVSKMSVNLASH